MRWTSGQICSRILLLVRRCALKILGCWVGLFREQIEFDLKVARKVGLDGSAGTRSFAYRLIPDHERLRDQTLAKLRYRSEDLESIQSDVVRMGWLRFGP